MKPLKYLVLALSLLLCAMTNAHGILSTDTFPTDTSYEGKFTFQTPIEVDGEEYDHLDLEFHVGATGKFVDVKGFISHPDTLGGQPIAMGEAVNGSCFKSLVLLDCTFRMKHAEFSFLLDSGIGGGLHSTIYLVASYEWQTEPSPLPNSVLIVDSFITLP